MPTGTITALRIQEHDKERVNVFIDQEFALGISLNTLTREALYVGKAIDADVWVRLEEAERYDKVYSAALRYLDARPRSTAELREKLERKEYAAEMIDVALARLTELGLVDDAAFARFWVENRQIIRPRGSQALRDELRRKGVARDVINTTLTDTELVGDQNAQAWTLARAAMRKYGSITDRQSFQRRMGGYLQRRGFGFDTVRPILATLWNERHGSEADQEDADDL